MVRLARGVALVSAFGLMLVLWASSFAPMTTTLCRHEKENTTVLLTGGDFTSQASFSYASALVTEYLVAEPFEINRNSDFTVLSLVTNGNGTPDDPWIIENLFINGSATHYCIKITDTTDSFIIRNCSLCSKITVESENSGVSLVNVENGLIIDNLVTKTDRGIRLKSSGNNVLRDNRLLANKCGISLEQSCNNTIVRNNGTNNLWGFECHFDSNDNVVEKNDFSNNGCAGIQIYNSVRNKIINNALIDAMMTASDFNYTLVADNVVSDNWLWGILFSRSSGVTIINNTICNNGFEGLNLCDMNSCTIKSNTFAFNSCGIDIEDSYAGKSSDNIIDGNELIGNGISLGTSRRCRLTNNSVTDDGIRFYDYELAEIGTHSIDASNTVNGRPIIYWANRNGGIVPRNAGQVILVNCTGVVVERQNISDVYSGIQVFLSDDNYIYNNSIFSCSLGISLINCDVNTVKNNTLSQNFIGIDICQSHDNILYHNRLIHNNYSALDSTGDNKWYHDRWGGNYWSDYIGIDEKSGYDQSTNGSDGIGDTPYTGFESQGDLIDKYPLMEPELVPSIPQPPENASDSCGLFMLPAMWIFAMGAFGLIKFRRFHR